MGSVQAMLDSRASVTTSFRIFASVGGASSSARSTDPQRTGISQISRHLAVIVPPWKVIKRPKDPYCFYVDGSRSH
jgi:hypothetical protein